MQALEYIQCCREKEYICISAFENPGQPVLPLEGAMQAEMVGEARGASPSVNSLSRGLRSRAGGVAGNTNAPLTCITSLPANLCRRTCKLNAFRLHLRLVYPVPVASDAHTHTHASHPPPSLGTAGSPGCPHSLFSRPGVCGCFLRPGSSRVSLRTASAGQSLRFSAVPTDFTALAWFWSGGLGRAGGFPSGSAGLGLRFPNGVSITCWPAGRLAGGLSGSRPLPSPAPQLLISCFMAPGPRRGACSLDVRRFLLASPSRRGPWGSFKAFRSHFIGVGLPDALGRGDFQGNLVSLPGSHPVSSVFALAAPGLACFAPHLVLGFCGLSVAEGVQGRRFPTAAGTQTELCV